MNCGLCCDGTLFNHAKIKENEPLATGYAFDIILNEKRAFKLPCPYVKDKLCSIYHERPYLVCESFKCKLLKGLRNGEISFDDAMKVVNETVSLRTKIESQLLEHHPENTGDSLLRKMKEFNAQFAGTMSEVEFRRKYGKLLLAFFILTKILNESFRRRLTKK